jgi:hypothetical protein
MDSYRNKIRIDPQPPPVLLLFYRNQHAAMDMTSTSSRSSWNGDSRSTHGRLPSNGGKRQIPWTAAGTSKIAPAVVLGKVLTLVFAAAKWMRFREGRATKWIFFFSYPTGYQLKSKHKQMLKLNSFLNKSSQLWIAQTYYRLQST